MESKVVSVRLPAWLLKELDGDARALGVTRSDFVKTLYINYKQSERELDEYLKCMAIEAAEAAERN